MVGFAVMHGETDFSLYICQGQPVHEMKKRTWIYVAVCIALAAVCVRLLFERGTVVLGLSVLLLGVMGFLVWKAFIKNGREDLRRSRRRGRVLEEEIGELKKRISGLSRELDEKSKSKFNVMELSPILHLAVMNIDTSFVRTYIRESDDGIVFNGALRADICAEYGVKLEEVRFKYDEASNTLLLSNFHPGLLSFSKKQLNWEIAKSYRTRNLFGMDLSSVCDSYAEAYTKEMCEKLRTELEREIDERKLAEFDWLSPMIYKQITDIFKMIVGKPDLNIVSSEVPALEADSQGYLDYPSFKRLLEIPETNITQAD